MSRSSHVKCYEHDYNLFMVLYIASILKKRIFITPTNYLFSVYSQIQYFKRTTLKDKIKCHNRNYYFKSQYFRN